MFSYIEYLTIIPTDPIACATALRPSDIFIVTDWPTNDVSVDSLFINSPVFVLSKKPISCLIMELNSFSRIFVTILYPEKGSYYIITL